MSNLWKITLPPLPEGTTGVRINGEYIELVKPRSRYRGFFTKVGRRNGRHETTTETVTSGQATQAETSR
jgi:hypothetical protein